MLLWELFRTFLMIGAVSFGGGYAMIPVIEREVVQHHRWMTAEQFTDAIAVAGMSPGPIATNSAIFVGYRVEGVAGAIVSAAGMVLPSLFIILAVGFCFYRVRDSKTVQAALYGLRPVITGLIVYAAVVFAFHNELAGPSLNWHTFSLMSVFAVSLFVLLRLKWHPALVILLSGAAGVILYS